MVITPEEACQGARQEVEEIIDTIEGQIIQEYKGPGHIVYSYYYTKELLTEYKINLLKKIFAKDGWVLILKYIKKKNDKKHFDDSYYAYTFTIKEQKRFKNK